MRRLLALALAVSLTLAVAAPAAEAGHASVVVDVGAVVGWALAAPFIIVGSIVAPIFAPLVHPPRVAPYPTVPANNPVVLPELAYAPPTYWSVQAQRSQATVGQQRPAAASPTAAAASPTVVQYPHGRYELRGDGIYTAYRWVWIPSAPPPPPPPRRSDDFSVAAR